MTQKEKLINRILSGSSDHNIEFKELAGLLTNFAFNCRIKGSHHIFYKNTIEEIINIQPLANNKAKPYQVKQIRLLILKYHLNLKENA
jgi:hypothetical protein